MHSKQKPKWKPIDFKKLKAIQNLRSWLTLYWINQNETAYKKTAKQLEQLKKQ